MSKRNTGLIGKFNVTRTDGKTPFTVLRDQSSKPDENGELKRKVTPLSLKEFRQRIESNDPSLNLRDFRSTCGCMHDEQIDLFALTGTE